MIAEFIDPAILGFILVVNHLIDQPEENEKKNLNYQSPPPVPALIRSSYLCGAEDDNSSGKKIPKVGPGRGLHVFNNNDNNCFANGFQRRSPRVQ